MIVHSEHKSFRLEPRIAARMKQIQQATGGASLSDALRYAIENVSIPQDQNVENVSSNQSALTE